MSNYGYSWRNARHKSSFLLPKSEHFGRWLIAAVVLGVVFHGVLYVALEKIPVLMAMVDSLGDEEHQKESKVTMVEMPELKQIKSPPLDKITAPPEESLKISEQVAELEDVMDNFEFSPEHEDVKADLKLEAPAIKGDSLADDFKPIESPMLELDVPEVGRNNLEIAPTVGEIKVDPGQAVADLHNPDAFLKNLTKKGAEGKASEGLLKDFTTLEDMKEMDGNALANAKALIGSDLLFEFGKAKLKGSAKNSLMTVAFLIDNNPELFCVLDGHTDTVGDEAKNLELSRQRAQAVKDWLVKSLLLDPKRIIVRAYGESLPLIAEGDKNAQAINRRVVISMKKDVPVEESTPKAILVRPGERAEVPSEDGASQSNSTPPKANIVEPVIPRAEPIEQPIPKAVAEPSDPSQNDPPRAVPVGEQMSGFE